MIFNTESFRVNKFVSKCTAYKRAANHYIFHSSKPKIYVNSIQKSGTHLLANGLGGTAVVHYYGRKVYNHDLTRNRVSVPPTNGQTLVRFFKEKALHGELIRGHADYCQKYAGFLAESPSVKHILLVRNPLEATLSLANWWEVHREIDTRPYLHYKKLDGKKEKLRFLLFGDKSIRWGGILERYRSYQPWLEDENTLVVKFENLVRRDRELFFKILDFLFCKGKISMRKKKKFYHQFMAATNPANSKTYINAKAKKFSRIDDDLVEEYCRRGGNEILQSYRYGPITGK